MGMTAVEPSAPAAETDLRCVGCGYLLRGLPASGNCPECGRPIERSLDRHRGPSAFEAAPSVRSFLRTTAAVLFRPTRFYRSLSARHEGTRRAAWFARCHRLLASVLIGL